MPDTPTTDSIRERLGKETAAAIDAKMASWFGATTELEAYDADAVLELGRKVI